MSRRRFSLPVSWVVDDRVDVPKVDTFFFGGVGGQYISGDDVPAVEAAFFGGVGGQ
jgi:hypothetical protein